MPLVWTAAAVAEPDPTPPWLSRDVGRVGQAGTYSLEDGAIVLHGSGADIWGRADGFHFVHLPWEGDVEIIARVLSVEKTDPWAKAGLMIRAGLTETSPHAMVAMTPEKGPVFIRRLQPGGSSKDDAHQAMRVIGPSTTPLFQQRGSTGVDQAIGSLTALSAPRWIKLVRRGQVFTAYDSSDGLVWEWLGTETLELPTGAYVGLAVSSHDASRLCQAVFDQVTVGRPDPAPETMARTGTGDGLQATYYSAMGLSGPSLRRIDPTVDFDWGLESPAEGIGRDRFSVRWEAELEPQFTEPYALHLVSDDRARLWLNGHLLIDEWAEHPEAESTAVVGLEAGKRYLLRVEYFENRGRALARLLWSSPSTPKQTIPSSQLYSELTDLDQDGLPDLWERAFGLDPNDPSDAGRDANEDGLSNLEAYRAGNDPTRKVVLDEGLPAPWVGRDVGLTGLPGTAQATRDGFTLQASGHDIWANADAFHFVHQPWQGDGELVARIVSQEATDPWAKAGLMLRESLRAEARHVMLAGTPAQGVVFLQRPATAASTAQQAADAKPAGPWLKLLRRGDTLSAFTSNDGLDWHWLGTEAIAFPPEIYAGLAVTSHDNSRLGTAVFDQVSLRSAPAASPEPAKPGGGDGLLGTYFDGATGAFVRRIDPTVDFDWELGAPAAGIAPDHFSVRWEGWLEVPRDDLYALHVLSDDGARLWLDGELLIDAWQDRPTTQSTVKLSLKAGHAYALKLEYFDRSGEAIARLCWSTPTLAREPIPQSQLYSAPPPGLAFGSAPASLADATPEETSFGPPSSQAAADPPSADAAAPGTSGLTITGVRTVVEVPGAAAVTQLGRWDIEGDAILAADRRGALEYDLNVPTADLFQLEIEGASANPFDPDRGFYLLLSVDGEFLGRVLLDAGVDRPGVVRVLTPWLKPGPHRFRLFWDNARKGRSLQVNALRLQTLEGPDTDQNGVKDWVEQKLATENAIETVAGGTGPTDSKTTRTAPAGSRGETAPAPTFSSAISPACLEGRGGFLSMMTLRAGDREVIQPGQGAGERWFANVPLSAEEPTAVQVSFQNGGRVENCRLIWEPTNLLVAEDLLLRQGDALLLTVSPTAEPRRPWGNPGAAAGTVQIAVAGVTRYSGLIQRGVPCRFEEVGAFEVTGSYEHPNGSTAKRSIHVRVVGASLGEPPVAWVRRERVWECRDLPVEAVLDGDPRLRLEEEPGSIQGGGRRFRLEVDAAADRWVLARAGAQGPVVASMPVRGLDLYGASEAGAFYGREYEDGSRLVETAVIASRLFPDVRVQIDIIVGGVMFEDGTLAKVLRAEDFDPTGLTKVHFVMPPGIETSNCHVMRAYQNRSFLGEY